ncbi:MAG: peptidoglycan-associated lipoprotein [Cyclobacteriaceae bacterium]|jgi:peptidoglycan-associated lipoprotein
MKQLAILLFLILLLQSCSQQIAKRSFEKGEFDRAIELYKKGMEEGDPIRNFQIAESYRKSNRLKEAARYYAAAEKNGSKEPSLAYYYARSLKANEQYDEAERVLNGYVAKPAGEKKFKDLAQYELDNLQNLDVIIEQTNYYRIKNLEGLNTPRAEYSPVYLDGLLYFTSNRNSERIYLVTGTPFTDIYTVQTQGANVNIRTLALLDPMINHDDTNEGSIAISPDGTSIIFAKGNSGKATGNTEVNLYFTRFRNGQWSDPRPLSINDPESWDSTPALTPDGGTLYFSSTREGGFGGADIYSVQLNRRGRWVDIKNLGPQINTPGDEVFPNVSADGNLYFSSDGHPGFGNLDLFVAKRERGKINVENLGQPMNSHSDDFGLYQFDLSRGFFTSNRPGGKGDDDIYTYVNDDPDLKIINYYLEGVTVTKDDGGSEIILPNTKVALHAENGEVVGESFTGEDGAFKFRVYTEENYNIIGEKTDYFTTRINFSTVGKSVDRSTLAEFITNVTFESKIPMERIVLEKSMVLNNIYYDLDKADIRPDAAIVLDSLVGLMNDNPEIYVELGSHTDARAEDVYNMNLSIRRARSAVQYMIKNGVSPERITAKGYGETQLIVKNAQMEEEHQKNRRTEFKVLRYNPAENEDHLPSDQEFDEYDRFFDE